MSYEAGDFFNIPLLTRNTTTGEPGNADTLPAAVLWRNGVATATALSISGHGSGDYDILGQIPGAWAAGDTISLKVRWTADGVNDGVNFSLGRIGIAESIENLFSTEHGAGSWQQAIVESDSGTGVAPDGSILQLTQAISINSAETWQSGLTVAGSAGWRKFVLTIKQSRDDTDADALVMVQRSADDSGDGLIILNRRPAFDANAAALQVTEIAGTASITWDFAPSGIDIPPSPDGTPYVWEVTRFTSVTKRAVAGGMIAVGRLVLRDPNIPA